MRGRGSKPVLRCREPRHERVAPRAGARIETIPWPMPCERLRVAPRAGARIETSFVSGLPLPAICRPPCGGADRNGHSALSSGQCSGRPPCGGADRNSGQEPETRGAIVAPRAGARIETVMCMGGENDEIVAPRAGARIETARSLTRAAAVLSRPPCGGADRNRVGRLFIKGRRLSPPVRGRGSKPALQGAGRFRGWVAPRAGARIETIGCILL